MSATDVLRRLLDERGIEHYDHENGEPLRDLSEAGTDPATSWRMGGANVYAVPNKYGTFDLWIDNCIPEQAIAATVGSSCASCPGMDGHVHIPTNPRNTCVVLEGEKPPEEVMFVGPDGVTHYLPEVSE